MRHSWPEIRGNCRALYAQCTSSDYDLVESTRLQWLTGEAGLIQTHPDRLGNRPFNIRALSESIEGRLARCGDHSSLAGKCRLFITSKRLRRIRVRIELRAAPSCLRSRHRRVS